MTKKLDKTFTKTVTKWFCENKRDLPWRQDREPYHIWISEIMLQQTRVEAVREYYLRWMKALPTIKSLADAEEESLLKLWQGLGYYNRVRNMQKAARILETEYDGVFPDTYDEHLKLPGNRRLYSRSYCIQLFRPEGCSGGRKCTQGHEPHNRR